MIDEKTYLETEDLIFDEEEHTYTGTVSAKKYTPVSNILKKFGFTPSEYAVIPPEILKAKAAYGTNIHKALEAYIKGDETQLIIPEVAAFAEWLTSVGMTTLDCISEKKAFSEYYKVAGTVDLQLWNIVADFKTTATLHTVPVMWQLSLYNFLLHPNEADYNLYELKCFWFSSAGTLSVKDIPLVPYNRLLSLLDAFAKGEEVWVDTSIPVDLIEKVNEIIKQKKLIDTLKKNLKALESERDILKGAIEDQMKEESRIYVVAPTGIVTLSEVTQSRYDTSKIDALLRTLKEEKSKYTKTSIYTKLNIKES